MEIKSKRITVNAAIENLDTLQEAAKEVSKKAEELEQAIQRLNAIELSVTCQF